MDSRTISICIPTWNRTDLVVRAIEQVVHDPRVHEIVIVDDASPLELYFKLEAMLEPLPKIKLSRNGANLDCYANKNRALELASNDWCILLDSDNVIDTSYLDALYAIPEWVSNTFYCPEFARPHFDYTMFAGQTITKKNVHKHVGSKAFDCLINTANYFVYRGTYMWHFNPSINPHAADTIYINSELLRAGGKMYVVPGMQYFHDVHDGSHYKANHHKSNGLFKELREKLNSMR